MRVDQQSAIEAAPSLILSDGEGGVTYHVLRCGYPIAEPAPDYVRCGGPHPRIPDLIGDPMTEAVHRQFQRARESAHVDRTGWTDDQWIDDAERLMNEPDGAITSLVNGHVMALLRRVAERREDER